MPSSPGYVRDYKREAAIRSTPKDKAENASRKRARRVLEKEGVVKKGDGKDVDHKNRNPMSNGRKNLGHKPKVLTGVSPARLTLRSTAITLALLIHLHKELRDD